MRSLNPFDHIKELEARIEALEAALREIVAAGPMVGQALTRKELIDIARAALDKDAQ